MSVRERPILFSGEMVRAILSGRKTQTRRVIREWAKWVERDKWEVRAVDGGHKLALVGAQEPIGSLLRCPFGEPGDRLWVRETWAPADLRYSPLAPIRYRADGDAQPVLDDRWRPSIHMPREFSRITLEVVDVRVQRLQDISNEDANAEGVPIDFGGFGGNAPPWALREGEDDDCYYDNRTSRENFALLWDSINGERSPWARNDWVRAVTFQRIA